MAERVATVKLAVDSTQLSAGVGKAKRDLESLGNAGHAPSRAFRGAWTGAISMVGGEFANFALQVTDSLDLIGHKGAVAKLAALGGVTTALGGLLSQIGSGDKQAADQLKQAVGNAGKNFEDYGSQIEQAIKSQENLGHGAVDTQEALRKMTQATNDPAKALDRLSMAADLAAARHITLSEAADMIDKGFIGKGARLFAQYGIAVAKTVDPVKEAEAATKEHTKALNHLHLAVEREKLLSDEIHAKKKITAADEDKLRLAHEKVKQAQDDLTASNRHLKKAHEDASHAGEVQAHNMQLLHDKIKGQAEVAVDNFSGKISVFSAKATDALAQFGNSFGGIMISAGPALMGVAALMQIASSGAVVSAAKTLAAWATTFFGMARGVLWWAGVTIVEYAAAGAAAVASGLAAAAAWVVANAPMLLLIATVGAVVAAVVYAFNHWTWFHNGVIAVWNGIKTVTAGIISWWSSNWPKFSAVIVVVWNAIKSYVQTYIRIISDVISAVMLLIHGNWKGAWAKIQDAFSAAWNWIKSNIGPILAGLWNSIKGAISSWAGQMLQAGKNLLQGLIDGIQSKFGSVIAVIQSIAGGVIGAFKSILGIKSPSTVFRSHGIDIVAGLVAGIEYGRMGALNAAANLATGVGKKALESLKTVLGNRNSMASQISTSLVGDVTQIQGQNGGPVSSGDLMSGMKNRLARLTQFANNIKLLRGMGLSKEIITQIVNAGLDSGGATAAALVAAGRGGITQANSIENRSTQIANSIGMTQANSVYGAEIARALNNVEKNLGVHVKVYLDGKELHSSNVRHAQRYKNRNGSTALA